MDWASIGVIISAVLGSQVLTTIASGVITKNKTSADAASVLVTSMLDWQKTLTNRISDLEKALNEKESLIDELRQRVIQLEAHVGRLEELK